MLNVQEIVSKLTYRKLAQGQDVRRWREMAAFYNSDHVVPMPEIDQNQAPAIANLFAAGIDGTAQRIASYLPDIYCPPRRPEIQRSVALATQRRRAYRGWLESADYDSLFNQQALYYCAYGQAPMLVYPDKNGRPCFEVKNPLDTFASPRKHAADIHPEDCIFLYARTLEWLITNYPAHAAVLQNTLLQPQALHRSDVTLELVEYRDANQSTLAILGPGTLRNSFMTNDYSVLPINDQGPNQWGMLLENSVNLTGVCPVVRPYRITLDRNKGQFDDMAPIAQMQARLMGLDVEANFRSVFPKQYWIRPENSTGEIVPADPFAGIMGEVEGGSIQVVAPQAGPLIGQALDRLERSARIDGSVPAEMTGESGTNIRTDRRGLSVLSSVLDFPLRSAQMNMAKGLKLLLEIATEFDTKYMGDRKKSYYVSGIPGAIQTEDYVPNVIFGDSKVVKVRYPRAGQDAQSLVVQVGQEIGANLISRETGMRLLPDIDDVDRELTLITGERLHDDILAAVGAQVQQGALDLMFAISLKRKVSSGKQLEDAFEEAHKEQQQQQAAQAAAQQQAPGAPGTQPGANQAAQGGAQAGPPPIPPPQQAAQNLNNILREANTARHTASAAPLG